MSALAAEIRALLAQIGEDLECHEGDWTKPGFQALLVYRFGVFRMKIDKRKFRAPLSLIYRQLFRFVRNFYGIELPYTAQVGRRVVFEHQGDIVIHGSSVIGDNSIIRQGVTLGNRYMERPNEAPILSEGVSVGAGAKVLGNVRIGKGAKIGANAVVIHDVDDGLSVVGNPAREVGRAKDSVPPPPSTKGAYN